MLSSARRTYFAPPPSTISAYRHTRHRFDARAREYKYFIVQDGSLDVDAMREAAGHLVGEHDFRNFCKADVAQVRRRRKALITYSSSRSLDNFCVASDLR